jgi:hypothetical protein
MKSNIILGSLALARRRASSIQNKRLGTVASLAGDADESNNISKASTNLWYKKNV